MFQASIGTNQSGLPDGTIFPMSWRNELAVQESVVRTRPCVLPPMGTGGTSRTWLTRDDVRVALSHF